MLRSFCLLALLVLFFDGVAQTTYLKTVERIPGGYPETQICEAIGRPGHIILSMMENDSSFGLIHVLPDGQFAMVKRFNCPGFGRVFPQQITPVEGGYAVGFVQEGNLLFPVLKVGLLMLDTDFNIRWSKLLGFHQSTYYLQLDGVLPAENKGLYVLSTQRTDPDIASVRTYHVSKLDSTGDLVWSRQNPEANFSAFQRLGNVAALQRNGNLLIASGLSVESAITRDGFGLTSISPDGDIEWTHNFLTGSNYNVPLKIKVLPDGGFAVLFLTNRNLPDEDETHVAWFNDKGLGLSAEKVWSPDFRFLASNMLADLTGRGVTLYGGYLPASNEPPGSQLVHLNGNGTIDWATNTPFPANPSVEGMARTGSEGFLVSGNYWPSGNTQYHFLSKHDASGASCASEPIQIDASHLTYSLTGTYTIVWDTVPAPVEPIAFQVEPWSYNYSNDCIVLAGGEAADSWASSAVFPNPMLNEGRIRLPFGNITGYEMIATDCLGRVHLLELQSEGEFTRFSVQGLSPGLYAFKLLRKGEEVLAGKFVVER